MAALVRDKQIDKLGRDVVVVRVRYRYFPDEIALLESKDRVWVECHIEAVLVIWV